MAKQDDMTGDDGAPPGAADALFLSLHPNQSLSRSGFLVLMSLITAISFVTGLLFWSLGAWPIFGFFGLDVVLIYLAFRYNFRAARRFETIRIGDDRITITRIAPDGREKAVAFDAYWARALIEKGRLQLVNRGLAYEIGAFLGEEEKLEVRDLITRTLRAYRAGDLGQSASPSTSIMS